jgi:general stress protein CsbA
LLVLLLVVVFIGVTALYTGSFAFIFNALDVVGTTAGGLTHG